MRDRAKRRVIAGAAIGGEPSTGPVPLEIRVLAEQVRMLYARAPISQAAVVVNAGLVSWVFWGLVARGASIAWLAALCASAALRMALVRAYRRASGDPWDAPLWARRFTAETALTGAAWGAAALVFFAPSLPVHQVFLAFVLGGMAAGAAASNASHAPAFAAFAVPALAPMVARLAAERAPMHAVMAFMVAAFGVAVGAISRAGSRTLEEAIRLRFRNELLVEALSAAQRRLEGLNADLERRVRERTAELERALDLRGIAEQALRESDRRKGEFIAILSHELRNPLTPIRNCLYLLDRAAPSSEQAKQALGMLGRQTGHLARLVDDLLDVTRISRGKIELRRERLDLRDVTVRTCDDHRALFEDRGIQLRVEAAGPTWIDADETRVSQVVSNLLQNAAKFTRPGGTVGVSLLARDGRAELRVRDDGVGIRPDLLPRLFEPFVQAERGPAAGRGGLGLGLALAKSLVELHGGSIRAHSEGTGHGSEFVVSLPLAPAPAPAPPDRTEPLHPICGSPLEILVIEDNADEAQSIAALLRMEGHRVHVAADGRSGLAKARELDPQVVVCDIGLPDLDGYQVARALKARDRNVARLIALTGYAQPEDRLRAEEAGFDAHLAKPPPLEKLLEAVRGG